MRSSLLSAACAYRPLPETNRPYYASGYNGGFLWTYRMIDIPAYGQGDASYLAAGGLEGLTQLVHDFYQLMDSLPEARALRALHPADLAPARDKLCSFLSGWLGGPRLFAERYGAISIPAFHAQWRVDQALSDAWIHCMSRAISLQPYAPEFADYLLTQLRVPAQRIVQASHNRHHQGTQA